MRKKYILSFILFLIIILICSDKVEAYKEINVTLYDFGEVSELQPIVETDKKNKGLEFLKTTLGYTGNGLPQGKDTMKFETKIYLLKEYEKGIVNKTTRYKIQIGGGAKDPTGKIGVIVKDLTEDELINTYGYKKSGDEVNVDDPAWDAILLGTTTSHISANVYHVETIAEKIFTGKDYEEGKNAKVNSGAEMEDIDYLGVEEGKELLEDIDDITNIFGHLEIKLLEFKRLPFDAIQSILNMIQTVNYGGKIWFLPWNITVKKDAVLNDYNKNQYINYTEGDTNLGSDGQKRVFVNEEDCGLDEGILTNIFFSNEPEFPIIPVDIYSMAKGKVDLFDTNFLTGQNNTDVHKSGSVWIVLRNFIAVLMHSVIYIGVATLIGALIWHGISIVLSVYKKEDQTPEERKNHIEGIHNFAKGLLLLVGSVLIMSLCIHVSDALFDDMKVTDSMELPIRVNVGTGNENGSGNKYSFSTNAIGYVRFMCNSKKPRFVGFVGLYSVVYIVLVVINTLAVICMFVRLIMLAVLSIVGPIIAVAYVFKQKSVFGITYEQWAINYFAWSAIQLVLAVGYRLILEICF